MLDVPSNSELKEVEGLAQTKSTAPFVYSNQKYTHTNLSNPIYIEATGDNKSFGNIKYADRVNHFRRTVNSGTRNGVNWQIADNFLTLDGTCTANLDFSVYSGLNLEYNMPAGDYIAYVNIDNGNSTMTYNAGKSRFELYVQSNDG